jgi:urea transport system substrate-binding protein
MPVRYVWLWVTVMVSVGLTACSWDAGPIRIGILHSLTGRMASSELPVVDATRFALDELNAAGGVLGRPLEVLVADGRSDPQTFAEEAERLIATEDVSVVFGCWTSVCRRTVAPVFEASDSLLFYPLQYEGLEESAHIVYMGAVSNQQIFPAINWVRRNRFKSAFLVGSDYVYPRAANAMIHDELERLRGTIVGEDYVPLGSTDFDAIVRRIRDTQPDIILNTVNGAESNVAFFEALRGMGISADDIPVLSFSVSEIDLAADSGAMIGHYVAWSYFQSVDTAGNLAFVAKFKSAFGAERPVAAPMVSAYVGAHMWAQAAEAAGSPDPAAVREHVGGTSFNGPDAMVHIDAENLHTWKPIRIGQIQEDGQIDVLWSSRIPIRPEPYPALRTPEAWHAFVRGLQDQWGGGWENPAGLSANQ